MIFPGGLPLHHRHGGRMLDVLLLREGEGAAPSTSASASTASSQCRPRPALPARWPSSRSAQGLPHVGRAAGWLFHLDAPNLMLTSLCPAADHPDAVLATLLECSGVVVCARCVRDPVRASVEDFGGAALIDVAVRGDGVEFEASANDLLRPAVEFSLTAPPSPSRLRLGVAPGAGFLLRE
ncbi:MAG: hypothetical protein U0797_14170 [Gemmataceae bacterium]